MCGKDEERERERERERETKNGGRLNERLRANISDYLLNFDRYYIKKKEERERGFANFFVVKINQI